MRASPPYRREVSSRSSGAFPSTLESRRSRSQRPTFIRQTFARIVPLRVSISTVTGSPLVADGRLHRLLVDVRLEIFFLLPAVLIKPLAEISLAVKQADADQWNIEVGRALDVIAGQDAQSAGIDRNRFVQAEFSREIRHRARPQNAGVRCAPGAVRLKILLLAAVGIVDPAVQHQFPGATFDSRQGYLPQQRDGIVIELPPACRIEVEEQAAWNRSPNSTRDCEPVTRAALGPER